MDGHGGWQVRDCRQLSSPLDQLERPTLLNHTPGLFLAAGLPIVFCDTFSLALPYRFHSHLLNQPDNHLHLRLHATLELVSKACRASVPRSRPTVSRLHLVIIGVSVCLKIIAATRLSRPHGRCSFYLSVTRCLPSTSTSTFKHRGN